MGPFPDDDSALAQAVILRDPDAWERFVGAFGDTVYGLCVAFVGATLAGELFTAYFDELRKSDFRVLRGYQAGKGRLHTYMVCDAHSYCMRRALTEYLHRPTVVEAVWHQLESYYKPALLRSIENLIQRAEATDLTADDLYQQLLVHLMEDGCDRLRKFGGEGSFRNWLRQVTANFVLDRLRQAPARAFVPIQSGDDGVDRDGVPGRLAVDPPDQALLPDQVMEASLDDDVQAEQLRAMSRALPQLSERSQLCLRMKYWEGQKPAEMAELLGEPVAKVYKVLEKNMEKLRDKMGALPPGGKSRRLRPMVQGAEHHPSEKARPR